MNISHDTRIKEQKYKNTQYSQRQFNIILGPWFCEYRLTERSSQFNSIINIIKTVKSVCVHFLKTMAGYTCRLKPHYWMLFLPAKSNDVLLS